MMEAVRRQSLSHIGEIMSIHIHNPIKTIEHLGKKAIHEIKHDGNKVVHTIKDEGGKVIHEATHAVEHVTKGLSSQVMKKVADEIIELGMPSEVCLSLEIMSAGVQITWSGDELKKILHELVHIA